MSDFSLDIKFKDYEWRKYACTKTEYPMYELVKWQEYNGKKSCYVIVFIRYNPKECYWEINDSMTRWLDIPEEDIIQVTKMTKHILGMLNSSSLWQLPGEDQESF